MIRLGQALSRCHEVDVPLSREIRPDPGVLGVLARALEGRRCTRRNIGLGVAGWGQRNVAIPYMPSRACGCPVRLSGWKHNMA